MFCQKCGNQLLDGASFCPKCGTKSVDNDTETQISTAPIPAATSGNVGSVPTQTTLPQAIPKKKNTKKIVLITVISIVAFPILLAIIGAIMMAISGEEGATQVEIVPASSYPEPEPRDSELPSSNDETKPETIQSEETDSPQTNTGEIMYKGVSVFSLFELKLSNLYNHIGNYQEENMIDGESSSFSYDYGDMMIYGDTSANEVTGVVATDPSAFSIDGVTLDKNRTGIIEILGNPVEESEEWGYRMIYYSDSLEICVLMNSPDEKAFQILIQPINYVYADKYEDQIQLPDLGPDFEWVEVAYINKYGNIEGVIKNISNKKFETVQISFEVFDSNGNHLEDTVAYISTEFTNGETARFEATVYSDKDKVASYKLSKVTPWEGW